MDPIFFLTTSANNSDNFGQQQRSLNLVPQDGEVIEDFQATNQKSVGSEGKEFDETVPNSNNLDDKKASIFEKTPQSNEIDENEEDEFDDDEDEREEEVDDEKYFEMREENNEGNPQFLDNSQMPKNSGARKTLYVGDLPTVVDESTLMTLFAPFNPQSCRICRNNNNNTKHSYAYVNFQNSVDANKAKEEINFKEVNGQKIRVTWKMIDPIVRKSNYGNIHVKNLPPNYDCKTLESIFSQFGTILSCKFKTKEKNSKIPKEEQEKPESDQKEASNPKESESKVIFAYGFVQFDNYKSAENAISKLNGFEIEGYKVSVSEFKPRDQRKQFTNLFVKPLPLGCTEQEIISLFEPFGEIQSVAIQEHQTIKKTCFGFCNFWKHESALKAIDGLNGREYCGQILAVGRFENKVERKKKLLKQFVIGEIEKGINNQVKNLYIKNIPDNYEESDLVQIFSQFGEIVSCVIKRDEKKNQSLGFGFCAFRTIESAIRAKDFTNGLLVGDKRLSVYFAEKKEARKRKIESILRKYDVSGASIPNTNNNQVHVNNNNNSNSNSNNSNNNSPIPKNNNKQVQNFNQYPQNNANLNQAQPYYYNYYDPYYYYNNYPGAAAGMDYMGGYSHAQGYPPNFAGAYPPYPQNWGYPPQQMMNVNPNQSYYDNNFENFNNQYKPQQQPDEKIVKIQEKEQKKTTLEVEQKNVVAVGDEKKEIETLINQEKSESTAARQNGKNNKKGKKKAIYKEK